MMHGCQTGRRGQLRFDDGATAWPQSLIRLIALGGGLVLVLFSWNEVPDRQAPDFFACLLLIVAGICLLRPPPTT